MSVPTFTAEASLYKSIRFYRGRSGTGLDTASHVVLADTACEIACGVGDAICLAACSGAGPLAPLCWAGCQAATVACLLRCQDGGGGGGGGGTGGGGTPKTCCEWDETRPGRCILWVPKGAECP
jgi:hypothetical protein